MFRLSATVLLTLAGWRSMFWMLLALVVALVLWAAKSLPETLPRELAKAPNAVLVQRAWRAAEITPSVREILEALPAGETLPPLPQTGWEETTLLAVAMSADPEAFIRAPLF